ncbi:MAG: kinase/pyrophosphorylase [Deltaproteobacteria bacterium]|nr:kinase/pyrophosphorylase [Deltaproteobacteria bacterium]
MSNNTYYIYAISDATGEMAMNVAFAALRQFKVENVSIVRRPKITDRNKIVSVLTEAKKKHAIVVHTFVGHELREIFHEEADKIGILGVDIMGPMIDTLTSFLHSTPSEEPGLKYKLTKEYFRRQEAVEFAVKHDDGLGMDTLAQADIILLGISRTSKTPLSIYLAHRGHKVANIPIVKDVPLPEEVSKLDSKKIFGLVVNPEKLVELREARLVKMGRPLTEEYAKIEKVLDELDYGRKLFRQLGVTTVDVTAKSIEEIATEILIMMGW